jgi:hypothetical protein
MEQKLKEIAAISGAIEKVINGAETSEKHVEMLRGILANGIVDGYVAVFGQLFYDYKINESEMSAFYELSLILEKMHNHAELPDEIKRPVDKYGIAVTIGMLLSLIFREIVENQ